MANTLNVSQALKTPGQLFPFSLRIDVASADVFGETVRFSPAELTGTLLGAGETVTVRGEMRCEATMACARCLRPVAVPLRVAVDERFSRRPDSAGEDGETRVIEESRIDLTDCARELLILELPMRVLCSEDCKGLCPVCGAEPQRGFLRLPGGWGRRSGARRARRYGAARRRPLRRRGHKPLFGIESNDQQR